VLLSECTKALEWKAGQGTVTRICSAEPIRQGAGSPPKGCPLSHHHQIALRAITPDAGPG